MKVSSKYCYGLTPDGVIFVLFTYNSFLSKVCMYVHCTRYNTMYRLCFLSDALAAQGAVQCGECARILRPVRTTQAHSEKIVTADKNIATFSASKQDSQPYMFLT